MPTRPDEQKPRKRDWGGLWKGGVTIEKGVLRLKEREDAGLKRKKRPWATIG